MSRDAYLRRIYGISEAEYNDLLIYQDGHCAIRKKLPAENRNLCVDHNKLTGANRGLLCDACNLGIGQLRHSQPLLRKAIKYLEEYDGPEVLEHFEGVQRNAQEPQQTGRLPR
jgi:hypothetical protein